MIYVTAILEFLKLVAAVISGRSNQPGTTREKIAETHEAIETAATGDTTGIDRAISEL